MSNYSSAMRNHDDGNDEGYYTSSELALLREVHKRVLWQLRARQGRFGGDNALEDSNRVAAAIMALVSEGVRDPEILERMALHSMSRHRCGLVG